jgi:hypothetical protein
MKGKNMKKEIKFSSVEKLRATSVVFLLVSTCLMGVFFVIPEQVSASDYFPLDDIPKFDYDNWNLELSKMNTYAREYVISQAETLILPSVKGLLIGGLIGFALVGGLVGVAVGMGIGGTIAMAISAAQNMVKFAKNAASIITTPSLDTSVIPSYNYEDIPKFNTEYILELNLDDVLAFNINDIPEFNMDNIPELNIPDDLSVFDIDSIPKLNMDNIPELNIPEGIPTFDIDSIPKMNLDNIPSFNPR